MTTQELPAHLNELSRRVIQCAIEVHRHLGPGLLERFYERAMLIELQMAGLQVAAQVPVLITYKGQPLGEQRLDLVVEGCLVLELKSIESISEVETDQVVSYLRAGGFPLGLLINFNVARLVDGVRRRVNSTVLASAPSANPSASSATSA